MIRELAKNPEFMELYDKEAYESAVRRELRQQGLEEGKVQGKKSGATKEIVAKNTGLTMEEINKIIKNLSNYSPV